MRQLVCLIFFILLFSLTLCSLPLVLRSAVAADSSNYKTQYNVVYTINSDGVAHTTMKIGLTNENSKYYASSYKLLIGFADVQNIRASDSQGAITPVLRKVSDGYQVELDFNDKVVGIGNTLHFTVSFDTKSIAEKHGNLWEIDIPATAKQTDFSAFTVTVNPPSSFGTPTIVRPRTKDSSLTFSKDDLGNTGILLLFGAKQNYAYQLTYHLKNTNVFPIETEIALPPSTNYQDSTIEDITPKPSNVVIDKDGNWLAQYRLEASQKVDVIVRGKASLSLYPKPSPLTSDQRALYTKEQPYWQQSNNIKKLAANLKTPRAIYDYVVKTLQYDFQRRTSTNLTRIGAANILKNPSRAVCLEFTDLFIALSRSAGIPAREVDGYAYSTSEAERPLSLVPDVLHAWPEYYDTEKRTWIMVDPTWGNTTGGMDYFTNLDLDHVAFVIKGADSRYPIPAGGYRSAETASEKDVLVNFTGEIIPPNDNFTLSPDFPDKQLAGFPISGQIIVGNIGYGLSKQQVISVHSDGLMPHDQQVIVPPIPPFGEESLDLSFHKTSFLTNRTYTFTIDFADKKISQEIVVTPFLLTKWHILGGIIFVILTIGLLIIAYKTRRLPFFRR